MTLAKNATAFTQSLADFLQGLTAQQVRKSRFLVLILKFRGKKRERCKFDKFYQLIIDSHIMQLVFKILSEQSWERQQPLLSICQLSPLVLIQGRKYPAEAWTERNPTFQQLADLSASQLRSPSCREYHLKSKQIANILYTGRLTAAAL